MKEFRIKWCMCPRVHNLSRVSFVEAENDEAAKAVLKDHIERSEGRDWFVIDEVAEYVRPVGGKVLA